MTPPTPPHVSPTRSPLPPPSSSPSAPEPCVSAGGWMCPLCELAPCFAQLQSRFVSFYRVLHITPALSPHLPPCPSRRTPQPPSPFRPACLLPRSRESIPPPIGSTRQALFCAWHCATCTPSFILLGGRYSNLLQLGPGEVPALCGCIKPGSDWAVGFIPGLQSLHFAHHTSSLLLVGRARPQRTESTLVDFPSGPNTFG